MLISLAKHKFRLLNCLGESFADCLSEEQVLIQVLGESNRGIIQDGPILVNADHVPRGMLLKDAPNDFRMARLQHYQINQLLILSLLEQVSDLQRIDELTLSCFSLKKKIILFKLRIPRLNWETHLWPTRLFIILATIFYAMARNVQNSHILL